MTWLTNRHFSSYHNENTNLPADCPPLIFSDEAAVGCWGTAAVVYLLSARECLFVRVPFVHGLGLPFAFFPVSFLRVGLWTKSNTTHTAHLLSSGTATAAAIPIYSRYS